MSACLRIVCKEKEDSHSTTSTSTKDFGEVEEGYEFADTGEGSRITNFADVIRELSLVGVVKLDEEDDGDGLQVAVSLLVLGLGRHRVAELGEELRHDRRDALVDPVLVHLQGRRPVIS